MASLFDIAHYTYAFTAWPPFIVGSCITILGLSIVLRERASRVSLAFLGLNVSAAIWLISLGAAYSSRNDSLALWWVKIDHVGVIGIPCAFLFFTLLITRRTQQFRWISRLSIAASCGFAITIFSKPSLVIGLVHYPWGPYPQYGLIGIVFMVFFFMVYGTCLSCYWISYHRLPAGAQQIRLRSLFYAFCVGLLGSVDYLACYHIPVYPVGYLAVFACILKLADVVWRFGFPDITPAFAANEVVQTMPMGLFVLDHDGVVCIVNPMACLILRKREKDILGQPLNQLMGVLVPTLSNESVSSMLPQKYEIVIRPTSMEPRLCSFHVSRMRDGNQRSLAYVCLIDDITEEKKMDEALKSSEERFRLMVENVEDYAIYLLDPEGRVISWNAGAERIKGYRADDILGQHFSIFFTDEDRARNRPEESLRMAMSQGRLESEGWRVRKDKTKFWAHVVMTALRDKEGKLRGFAKITRDETASRNADLAIQSSMSLLQKSYGELEQEVQKRTVELREEVNRRQQAEEALKVQAITDTLTNLYNRRGFSTLAEQNLALSRRQQKAFLVFMVDMDDLKPINDSYGHAEGDSAIAQLAEILRKTFRTADVLARIGGDEFCISVIEDRESHKEDLLTRLQENIDEHNRYSGRHYKLSVSIGAVRAEPNETASLEELMQRADDKMYEQKRHKGRSAPPLSDSRKSHIRHRL